MRKTGAAREATIRRHIYFALEGGRAGGFVGSVIEFGLIGLIIANVIAFTLQSEPPVRRAFPEFFIEFEGVSIAVFTIEYLARLWCAPEDPLFRGGAFLGRVRFALRPMMLIDFLAIAPGYVAFFIPFIDLRFLRLIRLLRLLKIARYSPALSTLAQVIVDERRALVGTLLLELCAMVFAAATMHAVEGHVMPQAFGTIPDAMWWALETLTTVGYGDVVPVTGLGRVVAGVTMIVGVGLLALPVGIVATGFVNTIHRRDFVVTFAMLSRVPLFQGFSASLLSEIMGLLRAQSVAAGGIISARGERAAAMYFVVSGEVEVELEDKHVEFSAGDFFGELALLHDTMRSASVIARSPTRLLSLSAEDFASLMQKHPALEQRLKQTAALKPFAHDDGITQSEINAAGVARDDARTE
ncbi:MAG TPA: cyclic nucleotide-gated ion channel [Rhizomicrobium sp.]|nr:cyclic nucleotide-gated ion channel [Rhizomicrobium sp.]